MQRSANSMERRHEDHSSPRISSRPGYGRIRLEPFISPLPSLRDLFSVQIEGGEEFWLATDAYIYGHRL